MNELTAFAFNSTSGELLSCHRSDKRLRVNELTENNLVGIDASAQSWLDYSGTGAAISWIVLYCKHSGRGLPVHYQRDIPLVSTRSG